MHQAVLQALLTRAKWESLNLGQILYSSVFFVFFFFKFLSFLFGVYGCFPCA